MSEQQRQNNGIMQAALNQTPSQPDENEISIDLVDLFYRLLGSWKLILCLALIAAIGMSVYTTYFVTPMYRATSIIYVLSPESIINMSSLQLGSALTSDYIKVFDMWEVHAEVIANLGLEGRYSYSGIKSRLRVTNTSGTRMLDISFTSPDREEAAAVANEYAKVASQYIQDTMSTDKPNIMSVALVPTNPISPKRTQQTALGFVAGFLLGVAIVFFQYMMDDKIKTPEDIRHYVGLTTLAVVPVAEDVLMDNPDSGAPQEGRKKE